MNAFAAGGSLQEFAEAERRAEALADRSVLDDRSAGTRLKLHRALPPLGPGSWRLGVSTLLRPHRHNPAAVLAGWLPRGFISTHPIQDLVRTFVHDHWPPHPAFWAVAADYATGRRIAFGRDDAPPASVAEAVAASCAIPRLLPRGQDRRPPLRRRRDLLGLEPRPAPGLRR
jgi:NTE family protein